MLLLDIKPLLVSITNIITELLKYSFISAIIVVVGQHVYEEYKLNRKYKEYTIEEVISLKDLLIRIYNTNNELKISVVSISESLYRKELIGIYVSLFSEKKKCYYNYTVNNLLASDYDSVKELRMYNINTHPIIISYARSLAINDIMKNL